MTLFDQPWCLSCLVAFVPVVAKVRSESGHVPCRQCCPEGWATAHSTYPHPRPRSTDRWHSGGPRVARRWHSGGNRRWVGGGEGGRGADVKPDDACAYVVRSPGTYRSGICAFETVFGHVWSPPPILLMPALRKRRLASPYGRYGDSAFRVHLSLAS